MKNNISYNIWDQSICWHCKSVTNGQCRWALAAEPIKGWKVKQREVFLRQYINKAYTEVNAGESRESLKRKVILTKVINCPNFIQDNKYSK